MIEIPIRSSAGEYRVLVGRGLLHRTSALLRDAGLSGTVRLVSDENVYPIYGPPLEDALRRAGIEAGHFLVNPGEPSKSLQMASALYDWLVAEGTERRDLLLALGGGVVGDLAGFVAATFLRGLRLVQLPTSLLAQVDSSVGGKVAVNHPGGKNLIGAFYPPSLVIADPDTLATLPARELPGALAEAAKMGAIMDSALFESMEKQAEALLRREGGPMEEVISRSIGLKARVVQADERESGLRATLNYGHTIGHGVEAATGYTTYRHGEAVALGMVGAARIALRMGLCDGQTAARQEALMRAFGLPVRCPGLSVELAMSAMAHDKKASGGRLSWVLVDRIGNSVVRRDVPAELVREVLEELAT